MQLLHHDPAYMQGGEAKPHHQNPLLILDARSSPYSTAMGLGNGEMARATRSPIIVVELLLVDCIRLWHVLFLLWYYQWLFHL